MKIVVTGSAGFLGRNLMKELKKNNEVYGMSRRASETTTHCIDLNDQDLNHILDEINPDVIVHCAALSNVDYCEEHPEEAELNNVKTTANLVSWLSKKNKKLIFISSDYVYPGESKNYDENSQVEPINIYGKTKLQAENLVKKLDNFAILRTTTVFGFEENGNNFLMQLLMNKNQKRIPLDQISNPTDVNLLVTYIKTIIEKNAVGIFVASGPESMSRLDFANIIADTFNLDKSLLIGVKTSELNQKALRPLRNGTNSAKIRALLEQKASSVMDSLKRIRNSL